MAYFESRLVVDVGNFDVLEKKIDFYKNLNVDNLILEPQKNSNLTLTLKEKIRDKTNINIFYRINLRINEVNEFKKRIKKFNKFPEILSIESLNKDVLILAARDSRVDIVSFSDQNNLKALTPGIVSLIKQNESFIEFSLSPLMIKNKTTQSKNFRSLYRALQLVMKLKPNCIISGNFKNSFDFRHPRALISICNTLLDIPLDEAKRIFKENPRKLLRRVHQKGDNDIFEEDVKIIKD
ncbi:MAG: RNase P subunit p30 family protein [Promethearchaeota archaeon]